MIGRVFIWSILLCVPQVYGHDTVEQRLLELERIIKLQGEAIVQQREEVVLLKTENNVLKVQVKNLEQQVNILIAKPDTVIEDTNTATNAGMKPLTNIGTEESTMSTDPKSLDKSRSIVTRAESDVAFYAYITGAPCLHDHETLVFNHEVTDLANAYNAGDGIFTVPVTGTYVFTWTIASRDDFYVAELIVNGNIIAHAFTDTGNETNVSQATGIVVLNVNAGDHVYIKREYGRGCNIHDSKYHLTSFAGWRLFG